jgi:glycosyltransferase involved in cell wall biosynthesis
MMSAAESRTPRAVILHNIISPYKTLLFSALDELAPGKITVLYLAETEGNRQWKIARESIRFAHRILARGTLDHHHRGWLALKTVLELEALRPEVLVICGYVYAACWAALAWAKARRVPVAVVSESHASDRRRTWLKETLKRRFVSQCDLGLAAGQRHRDYLNQLGLPLDQILIYGGVGGYDAATYAVTLAELVPERQEIRAELTGGLPAFLYVGRFSPEKNVELLLEAFAVFRRQCATPWALLLVGGGHGEQPLRERIAQRRIPDVHFAGFHEGANLLRYYVASDVFVLPSISEPWGLVVDEAMACGLPVLVSTACGCYPDIVQPGINGLVFDPNDQPSLVRQMLELAGSSSRREAMGRASATIIRPRTPANSAGVFLTALERLAQLRRPCPA